MMNKSPTFNIYYYVEKKSYSAYKINHNDGNEFLNIFQNLNLQDFYSLGVFFENNPPFFDFSTYDSYLHINCSNNIISSKIFCFLTCHWIHHQFKLFEIGGIFLYGNGNPKYASSIHLAIINIVPPHKLSESMKEITLFIDTVMPNVAENPNFVQYTYEISSFKSNHSISTDHKNNIEIRKHLNQLPSMGPYFLEFCPELKSLPPKCLESPPPFDLDIAQFHKE